MQYMTKKEEQIQNKELKKSIENLNNLNATNGPNKFHLHRIGTAMDGVGMMAPILSMEEREQIEKEVDLKIKQEEKENRNYWKKIIKKEVKKEIKRELKK